MFDAVESPDYFYRLDIHLDGSGITHHCYQSPFVSNLIDAASNYPGTNDDTKWIIWKDFTHNDALMLITSVVPSWYEDSDAIKIDVKLCADKILQPVRNPGQPPVEWV